MCWSGGVLETGAGRVEQSDGGVRLLLPQADAGRYSDAQIDDTAGLSRRAHRWRPPVTLSLHARFSHPAGELRGTAGFGFWNVPFGPGASRIPALPRALWFFFGSPPHSVPLAAGVPGHGWKAASLDAGRPAALCWAPLSPLATLAMRAEGIYQWLWPHIQRALAVREALVPAEMTGWHAYLLEWRPDEARCWVDDELLLSVPVPPRGPLGFVAWMDNQYAIASPRGRFGWGLLDVPQPQWLEITDLHIG